MIKIMIVDDEEFNLLEIEELIKDKHDLKIVGSFLNPYKALEASKLLKPDIAFLDIDMPGINGLELSEKLLGINPVIKIIFITAYSQYAVEAFEMNAVDYVLKPIRKERFNKALKRIIDRKIIEESTEIKGRWKILCFNTLEVYYEENKLKWKTEKEKTLFAYLFENLGKSVHKDKIIENLWFGSDYKNNLIYLQTTISRLRKSLRNLGGNFKIEYSNNSYQMNMENVDCDVFEFEKLVDECKIVDESKIDVVDKIINIYTGDYLAENCYVWSVLNEERLREKYLDLLINFSKYLMKTERYKIALKYLNILAEKKPYDDKINAMILLAYDKLEDIYLIIKHYQNIEAILRMEYDMEVPLETKRLFLKICKNKHK
ncbi:response regulator [Clostridium sp. OS1-26]|uniref:response regulator n=1 Tax=Clostridium sp. OS1-26 TaxID=3070681 RepID=UPI0027E061E8|nr:response regulator [Clostridium sp. OS1-26]WML36688.1 response regulator [Clostridium sp. OS1-26]